MISALGLDLGQKRIGVAGCDRTGLIASGLTTIHRTSFAEDVRQLQYWVSARQAQILVVGLPYTFNGELGAQAKRTQKLARRIAKALGLPLEFVDERCTSTEAEAMLRSEGLSLSQHKALIDRKAACLILQQWLDRPRIPDSPSQLPTA